MWSKLGGPRPSGGAMPRLLQVQKGLPYHQRRRMLIPRVSPQSHHSRPWQNPAIEVEPGRTIIKTPEQSNPQHIFAVFNLQSREWEGTHWEQHSWNLEHESIGDKTISAFKSIYIVGIWHTHINQILWSGLVRTYKMMLQAHWGTRQLGPHASFAKCCKHFHVWWYLCNNGNNPRAAQPPWPPQLLHRKRLQ